MEKFKVESIADLNDLVYSEAVLVTKIIGIKEV